MSDVEDDLQTTADAILADADRLKDLEERKRRLTAGDKERVPLSTEIAGIGHRLERATEAELDLAKQASEA
jgi:hypothetical protein